MLQSYFLTYSGAEVDQEGLNERTPLHEAAEAGDKNYVELLLGIGANTVQRDSDDYTPYDFASTKNYTKVQLSSRHLYIVMISTICMQCLLLILILGSYRL